MAHLLIVWHSQSGGTVQLLDAVLAGTRSDGIDDVQVRTVEALDGTAEDLRWADGVIFGTPENFGYMSGPLKTFLDRTFYEVEHETIGMPWGLFVKAGNDGRGAVTAVERIVAGLAWKQALPPVVARGEVSEEHLAACAELGATMAGGLMLEIF